mgnify:CR=1 FL=1
MTSGYGVEGGGANDAIAISRELAGEAGADAQAGAGRGRWAGGREPRGNGNGIDIHGIHREQEWNLALIRRLLDREDRDGTLNPCDEALLARLETATVDNGRLLLRESGR